MQERAAKDHRENTRLFAEQSKPKAVVNRKKQVGCLWFDDPVISLESGIHGASINALPRFLPTDVQQCTQQVFPEHLFLCKGIIPGNVCRSKGVVEAEENLGTESGF